MTRLPRGARSQRDPAAATELPEAVMEHYAELLDAERRALAYQEFIAYTVDNFGERMSSQWKAHARSLLADE